MKDAKPTHTHTDITDSQFHLMQNRPVNSNESPQYLLVENVANNCKPLLKKQKQSYKH